MDLSNIYSYAKLNLHLRITGKKENGNHLLQMLSIPISLHDTMQVSYHPQTQGVHVFIQPALELPLLKNLVYLAVMKYWEGSPPGMTIYLNKKIPLQAGLGGGSSNAASILISMNQRFHRYSQEDLVQLGFSLGTDIPFFLQGEESIVTGEGEVVTPSHFFSTQLYFVIVKPAFSLPTGKVYQTWDALKISFSSSVQFSSENLFPLHNDLLVAALFLEPSLSTILEDIKSVNPLAFSMTGSCSACFGLFSDQKSAEAAFTRLSNQYSSVFMVSNLLNG